MSGSSYQQIAALPTVLSVAPDDGTGDGSDIGTWLAGSGGVAGHRVVYPASTTAVAYASNTTAAHAHVPLWLTDAAAAAGSVVALHARGIVTEPSWSWTPSAPVYLGTAGQLTQTPPTAAAGAVFFAIVGWALSATTVLITPTPSVILA